ncbi:GNAT family N-acetyltransferase [Pseudooceanicola onchidii]|uniref:GNAT family N-acetyltransferase n=1 Tax=Pseudooceanicola onchidii TaxID=2562279 RepID=UPI00145B41C7|nr:GNAT family N-acetyltransferase [Pseudooceanicola onchidii]
MTKNDFIPTFDTARIHLRGGLVEDLDALDGFFSSQDSRYVGGPRPRGETWDALCSGIGHWALRGFGLWILTEKAEGKVLGVAGLQQPDGWPEPELIWVMFGDYTGQGLATEAVQGIRRYAARELGIKTPMSLIYPDYSKVVRMAEKMGARRIKDVLIPDGPVPAWRFPEPEEGTNVD